jgi:hypothetical protein
MPHFQFKLYFRIFGLRRELHPHRFLRRTFWRSGHTSPLRMHCYPKARDKNRKSRLTTTLPRQRFVFPGLDVLDRLHASGSSGKASLSLFKSKHFADHAGVSHWFSILAWPSLIYRTLFAIHVSHHWNRAMSGW